MPARLNGNVWRRALLDTLPVLAAYAILGIGFGMLMTDAGFSILLIVLMSVFIFAGSMQYVAVSLLVSQAPVLTTLLMTFLVNARHLFYGLSMLDRYKQAGAVKPYLIFGLTDETYSLVCAKPHRDGPETTAYYTAVTLLNHLYWIAGSVLGGVLGRSLAFNSEGIEFSMTALFIVIFLEQWRQAANHLPAVIGLAATAAALAVFGRDHFLLAAMAGITVLLLITARWTAGGVYGDD